MRVVLQGVKEWQIGIFMSIGKDAMKKLIILFVLFLAADPVWAKYDPYTFHWVETALYTGWGAPASQGESKHDIYMEFQGFHRYKLLDAYWFVDFFDIFNTTKSDMHGKDPGWYGEVNPRLSLDGLLNRDFSLWRFKELFLSYQMDFDNSSYGGGLKRNHFGLGSEFRLKNFDYFRVNLFARYYSQAYDSNLEEKWDGFLFNTAYGGTLYRFPYDIQLYFSGWLDFVFGADKSDRRVDYDGNDIGNRHSFQWFNQIRIMKGHFAISYSCKLNYNFTEIKKSYYNSTDSTMHILGFHFVY